MREKQHQECAFNDMMQVWMNGGGHVFVHQEKKVDGIFRIIWENWNSLKLFMEKDKDQIIKIDAIWKRHNVNVVAGCGTQVDWKEPKIELDVEFEDILGPQENQQGGAAYNSTGHIVCV